MMFGLAGRFRRRRESEIEQGNKEIRCFLNRLWFDFFERGTWLYYFSFMKPLLMYPGLKKFRT